MVTKIPRFTFEKFPQAENYLTTQMKSVGEVMAIGRTFQESFQKALRGLEQDLAGLDERLDRSLDDAADRVRHALRQPTPERVLHLGDAFRVGFSVADVQGMTSIDPWFLAQIEELIAVEAEVAGSTLAESDAATLRRYKRYGFSDARLGTLWGVPESEVRQRRHELGVRPVFKRVDSCAAEFPATTAYMYSSYEEECEAEPSSRRKIMVLGGGPNRIGQGIEFDYCCVHASLALREDGYETIMVNCNPETVSTDYDTSDRLYFEPLTLEDVLEVVETEQPEGIIVQYGGQTPLKLARDLEAAGAPIIGTAPDSIDLAEDRQRFQELLGRCDLMQPPNRTARTESEALELAAEIGYPLVVRPSYVLGGRAMEIVYGEGELRQYMNEAVRVSPHSPVLLDRFLDDAVEVDVDAVCDGERAVIGGIMQHIEQAGVHSGDSACSVPPYTLGQDIQDRIREQVKILARELRVVGLMNVQFAIQGQRIFLLEVNPRAARTVPYVSKACGVPLAKVAARCMAGRTLPEQGVQNEVIPTYYSVKEAVFPFLKFPGVDPILGPEMKSTGEVMGIGACFGEAYAKAQLAAGVTIPRGGCAFVSVRDVDKDVAVEVGRDLVRRGFCLIATHGTADALEAAGLETRRINKVIEGRPHVVDAIKNDEIDLIVNTTEGRQAIADSYSIRREALQHKVCYTTTIAGARAMCLALDHMQDWEARPLHALHREMTG